MNPEETTPGSFLYFIPDIADTKVTREWLKASTLSDVLRDCWERNAGWSLIGTAAVNNGPGGQSGVVICARVADDQTPGYYPAHQKWTDCCTHWVGVDERFPPTPESLQRRRIIAGVDVELADARLWHVPIIRRPSRPNIIPWITCLPCVETLAGMKSGKVTIAQRFAAVWEMSGKVFEWRFAGKPLAETRADSWKAAYLYGATFLGLNYRLGPNEMDVLQLIEGDDLLELLDAAIDAPTCDELLRGQAGEQTADPTAAPA